MFPEFDFRVHTIENNMASVILTGSDAVELLIIELAKPVSYTHLDVYKRQALSCAKFCKMILTDTPRERITDSILSKSSGSETLANSSIIK